MKNIAFTRFQMNNESMDNNPLEQEAYLANEQERKRASDRKEQPPTLDTPDSLGEVFDIEEEIDRDAQGALDPDNQLILEALKNEVFGQALKDAEEERERILREMEEGS